MHARAFLVHEVTKRTTIGCPTWLRVLCVFVTKGCRTAGVLLLCGGLARAETLDRVLAVVSGELITLSDVTAARDLGLVAPAAGSDPIQSVLATLVDRELVLAEVDRYAPPEPTADDVDRELQRVRARFPSRQAFEAALARSGINEPHVRETLRQNLRIEAYQDQRFTVPRPTDADLMQFYREHAGAFARNGRTPAFADVRADVLRAAIADRRRGPIAEWVAGLRRRADVLDLYVPGR